MIFTSLFEHDVGCAMSDLLDVAWVADVETVFSVEESTAFTRGILAEYRSEG